MKLKYHLSLLLANIAFGANYSFTDALVESPLGVNGLYFLRTITLFLIFTPLMFVKGESKIEIKDIWRILIITLLLVVGRMYLLLYGIKHTTPIDGSIINTLSPVAMIITTSLLFHKHINRHTIVGAILALFGAIVLIMNSEKSGGNSQIIAGHNIGNIAIFTAMILSVFNTIWVKGLYFKYSRNTILGWAYFLGILFVIPLFLNDFVSVNFHQITSKEWLQLAIYLLFGTISATFLLYYSLSGLSATTTSIYIYIQPVVATLMAVVVQQDKLSLTTIISSILIFVGVGVILYKKRNCNYRRRCS
ncbi:MAG: DMT family transporter [Rikenellaceae bacterium]